MSADEIQAIIRRSVIDRAFAKALRDNPHEALKEYRLNPIELAALKAMQIEFEGMNKPRNHRKRPHSPKFNKDRNYYRLD